MDSKTNNWINVYEKLAQENSDKIAKSGYSIDGKPIDYQIFVDWFESINRNFKVSNSDILLDIGCGSGIFLELFSLKTQHLFGADTSISQLEGSKKTCPKAVYKQSDALNIEFDGIKFNRLFCNSVFLLFESLDYANKVLNHFMDITATDAQIWIGDIPNVNTNLDNNYRRVGKSIGLGLQHYPVSFFNDFCQKHGCIGQDFAQKVKGKESANYRYDFMITKR